MAGFAVGAAAALGVWRLRRDPAMRTILSVRRWCCRSVCVFVSLFVSVLVPRYFIWGAAPFFVFAGEGLARLSGKYFAAAAASLAAIGLFNLLPYYSYETKPRWDLVANKLAAITRPGDVVLVDNYYAYTVLSVFAKRALLDHGGPANLAIAGRAADCARPRRVGGLRPHRPGSKAIRGNYRKSLSALGHPAD